MEKIKKTIEVEQACLTRNEFIEIAGKAAYNIVGDTGDPEEGAAVVTMCAVLTAEIARLLFSSKKEVK